MANQTKSPHSTKDIASEKTYWNSFYAKYTLAVPSQFCVLAATEIGKESPIVEFGCGNGRDSKYLSTQGFHVYATDLSEEAITNNKERLCTTEGTPQNLSFSICDVTNSEDIESIICKAREASSDGTLTVYNRFFLHSINESQELAFIKALGNSLKPGDGLYMEFRCDQDEALDKVHGKEHYRRYVQTSEFLKILEGEGFDVLYEQTGQGMAKYKQEDPFVSRVIAERK